MNAWELQMEQRMKAIEEEIERREKQGAGEEHGQEEDSDEEDGIKAG